MDKPSINTTVFLPHTVCQAAASGRLLCKMGWAGSRGWQPGGRAVASLTQSRPTAPQPEQQNRSGDSNHIQPQVQITRSVCRDVTGWVWGQAQDWWKPWPGTDMLSTLLQLGAETTAGAEAQLPSQEDVAPTEVPCSSVPPSSSPSCLI